MEQIVERAEGVPLFIEELTKAVLETTGSSRTDGAAGEAAPRTPLAVPATLHAALMARLDRLGFAAKEVARIGSVLGREFSYELLAALAPLQGEKELGDALQQLIAATVIVQRGQPPFASYTFKHALLQDAAYGGLLRGKRQQIHARVKSVLEESFPEVVETHPSCSRSTVRRRVSSAKPSTIGSGPGGARPSDPRTARRSSISAGPSSFSEERQRARSATDANSAC